MARPYKASSPYITNRLQAQKYADSLLPKVSKLPAVKWAVTLAAPDPRIEVWDVVEVVADTVQIVGQVTKISMSDRAMDLEVQVWE